MEKLLLQTDVIERNGRLYVYELVKEAINSPYIQERLATCSLYGEAGQPMGAKRNQYVVMTNVSHIIKDLYFKGKDLYGEIIFAETKTGRDMKGLYEQGANLRFALRGAGNVDYNSKGTAFISDLKIYTFDWVVY